MNRRLLVAAAASVTLLAACDSPGQLAQKPAAWTATYRVPYDVFAECIAQHERLPWTKVTPTIDSGARRATVSVAAATGSALGFYDIRSAGNDTIDVSYSSIYGGPGSTAGGDALDKANRCGNPR